MIQVEDKYAPLIDFFEKEMPAEMFLRELDTQHFDYVLYLLGSEDCGGSLRRNGVYTVHSFINVLKRIAGIPVTDGADPC